MLDRFARNWWVFALQGAVAVIFGILALIWPGLTLTTLLLLFGSYVLVDGVLSVFAGIGEYQRNHRWWASVVRGLAGIAIGVATFFWPGVTALVLLTIIAAWAIVTGVLEIVAGIQLRNAIENEWLIVFGGVLSVVFGLLLVAFPGSGALAVVWLIAAFAIVFGFTLIAMAFRLRRVLSEGTASRV